KMKKHHLALKKQRQLLYQEMTDAAFGQTDWVLSGRISEVEENIHTKNNQLLQKEHHLNRWHHMRDAGLRSFIGVLTVCMLVWTGLQVDDGSMQATLIAAFVLMMFSVTDALLPVNEAVDEIPAYMDSLERMDQLPDTSESSRTDNPFHLSQPDLQITIEFTQVNNKKNNAKKQ